MVEQPRVTWSAGRARLAARWPWAARGAAWGLVIVALGVTACGGSDGSRPSYLTGTGFVADRAGTFEVADPALLCAAIDPAWATLEPGYVGVEVDAPTAGLYGGVQLSFEAGQFVNWSVAGAPPPVWVNAVVVSGGGRHRVYDYRGAAAAGIPFVTSDGPLHAPPVAGDMAWIQRVGLCVADADATLVWRRQLAQYSRTLGVAVGPSGQVAIAGAVEGAFLPGIAPIGAEDVFVAVVDAGGAIAWARQFGSLGDDGAYQIAFAPDGGLVVAGGTGGLIEPGGVQAGLLDAFVMRLDAAGNVLWVRQVGTEGGDYGRGLAVDAQGGVHLLMMARALDLQSESLHVIRFGPGGNRLATTVLALQDEFVTGGGIALDGDGNAYVVGGTTGVLGMAQVGGMDAFVAKLDPNGDLDWAQQFGSAAYDAATAVALAPDGSLRVAVVSEGTPGGQPNLGGTDVYLLHIDVDGDTKWVQRVGSAAQEALSPGRHLAVDAEGASLIVGITGGPFAGRGSHIGDDDLFLVRVDADGDEVWRRQFGTAERDYGEALALDAEGFLWVAGGTEGHFAPDDADLAGVNAIVARAWP